MSVAAFPAQERRISGGGITCLTQGRQKVCPHCTGTPFLLFYTLSVLVFSLHCGLRMLFLALCRLSVIKPSGKERSGVLFTEGFFGLFFVFPVGWVTEDGDGKRVFRSGGCRMTEKRTFAGRVSRRPRRGSDRVFRTRYFSSLPRRSGSLPGMPEDTFRWSMPCRAQRLPAGFRSRWR